MKLSLKLIILWGGSLFFLIILFPSCRSGRESKKLSLPPLVIDTDITMGLENHDVDDGLAIASLILSEKYDIKGITLTFGNGTLDEVHERAVDLLSHLHRYIPLYMGAKNKFSLGITTEAAKFITDAVHKYDGKLLLLAIGPLTNLATAYKLSPDIAKKFREVVIMGGAVYQEGNVLPYMKSEYNFYRDPDSAKIVIDNFDNIKLFPLDICMDTIIGAEEMDTLALCTTSWCIYLYKSIKDWYDIMSSVFGGFYPYDLVAATYLLDGDIVVKKQWVKMDVSTEDNEYYGACITGTGRKIETYLDMDVDRFKEDFYKYLDITTKGE